MKTDRFAWHSKEPLYNNRWLARNLFLSTWNDLMDFPSIRQKSQVYIGAAFPNLKAQKPISNDLKLSVRAEDSVEQGGKAEKCQAERKYGENSKKCWNAVNLWGKTE